ncbi:hypothetical protein [Haloglycomyces albus]|uniref:hypothetical protein n=1 Tax=Haloglycomyces albus TaxID=526067 RepID=UPI00046D19EC|nr:hypothetical protein [Haloglycomyces albus]
MTQLEMSLPQGNDNSSRLAARSRYAHSAPLPANLIPWKSAIQGSGDPCALLDENLRIRAMSISALRLLGLSAEVEETMPRFLDAGIRFVDFSPGGHRLGTPELGRLPMLRAMQSNTLERGLARIEMDGSRLTMDIIASPLHRHDESEPSGVVAFLRQVGT